jgi:hypothetical protein
LLANAEVSVVPTELAKIEGFFAGFDQVAQSMKVTDQGGRS